MNPKIDVVVHVSGGVGMVYGTVRSLEQRGYSTMAQIMEDAKKRGHLSITTMDGVITVNIDHIILIREGERKEPEDE